MAERKTGLSIPAGILAPTTQRDPVAPAADEDQAEPGQGGDHAPRDEASPQAKTPRVRRKKAGATPDAKLEGRRLYLSEGTHFRLRMLAYQRGRNLSEVAEEVLDKALPRYDVNRVG